MKRYNPDTEKEPYIEKFEVALSPRGNVLEALLQISSEIDPTLAFRRGCRFKHCGLCAVTVNNKARLACLTQFEDGMTIGPLPKLPVIRDLVVDRRSLLNLIEEHSLFINWQQEEDFSQLEFGDAWTNLSKCRECMICQTSCKNWEFQQTEFAGPLLFVKLALLHFDPRDNQDRKRQALSLGIERCRSCGKCTCPYGVPIFRDAITSLLPE